IVGTLDYLSPEQIAGEAIDARSDIYSLGLLLFEMLTAELPFPPASRAESLARRIAGRARDIGDLDVTVPAHVRRIIRRCLERAPRRRYPGVTDALADRDSRRAGLSDRLPRRAALVLAASLAFGPAGVASWYWLGGPGSGAETRAGAPAAS